MIRGLGEGGGVGGREVGRGEGREGGREGGKEGGGRETSPYLPPSLCPGQGRKMLDLLCEREVIAQRLPQTTPERLQTNTKNYTIHPTVWTLMNMHDE